MVVAGKVAVLPVRKLETNNANMQLRLLLAML